MRTRLRIAIILTFTLLFAEVASAQSGLLYHWSFDTIVNNTFEEHVEGIYNGTIYDCSVTEGPVGNALYFDGNNDYARIPGDSLAPPPELQNLSQGSISVWFKADNIPLSWGIRPIFYYGNESACNFFDASNEGLVLEVGHSPIHNGSKRLYWTAWADGCGLPTFCTDSWDPIELYQWYHYVVVVGDDYNTSYLNGQLMWDRNYNFGSDTTTQFFADALVNEVLWLGRGHWDGSTMLFEGAIDELKIFDHALTEAEVAQEFSLGNLNVGVETPDQNLDFSLYPNPTNDVVQIQLSEQFVGQNTTIILHDLLGNEIFRKNLSDSISEVDVSALSSGTYFITVSVDNAEFRVEKLVVY